MNAITSKPITHKFRWLIPCLALLILSATAINAQQAEPLALPRATTELLTNGGFEVDTDADNLPDRWTGKAIELSKADQRKCNKTDKVIAHAGECAFRFKGNPGGEKSKLTQKIDDLSAIVGGTRLSLSAFVAAKTESLDQPLATAKIQLSDDSRVKLELLPTAGVSEYTQVTDSAVTILTAGVSVTKAKLSIGYGETGGSFRIDDISLTVTPIEDDGAIWQPTPGTTYQLQLTGDINTSYDVEMYDIDLFDTPQSVIDELHADGRKVVCYFSAGSFEDWRPDADDFRQAVIGDPLDNWPGEFWLDVRRLDLLQPIMGARIALAAEKNCDGVDPDNIDGYTNETGFPLSYADQLAYNEWLAAAAHELGLAAGLKNDLNQIPDLVDDFDWILNEQCFQYEECDRLLPFIQANKAVFGVEYSEEGLQREDYCPVANDLGFSWLTKTYDLGDLPPNSCLDYPPRSDAKR